MKYSLALISALATASLAGPIETRQSKKPFIEPIYDDFWDKCDNIYTSGQGKPPRNSEACQGTRDYCTRKLYEAMGEHFESPKACIDSPGPPPFKEPAAMEKKVEFCGTDSKFAGDAWRATSEPCLGTVEYCNKKHYEDTAETYETSDQCIAVRQKTNPEPAKLDLTPTAPPEKVRFPPQRDDVNAIDLPVSPQETEDLICNQFKESKDKCHPVIAQCVFDKSKHKFNSQTDFWQVVGECASEVLTLKGR